MIKFGKKSRMFLLLFLTSVLLSGCGEEKKGDQYLEKGSYAEAIEVYEGLLSEKDSESAREKNQRLYARMGQAYCYMEDYEKALECLNQAEELSAEEEELPGELYLYRGLSYEKLSFYEEAAADYEAYFAALPEEEAKKEETLSEDESSIRIFAYNELGLCYMKLEKYEEALAAIEAGLSLSPQEEKKQSLIRNKVVVLEYLSRFEEALTQCKEYLEEYPDDEEMNREYEFLKTRAAS